MKGEALKEAAATLNQLSAYSHAPYRVFMDTRDGGKSWSLCMDLQGNITPEYKGFPADMVHFSSKPMRLEDYAEPSDVLKAVRKDFDAYNRNFDGFTAIQENLKKVMENPDEEPEVWDDYLHAEMPAAEKWLDRFRDVLDAAIDKNASRSFGMKLAESWHSEDVVIAKNFLRQSMQRLRALGVSDREIRRTCREELTPPAIEKGRL